MKKILIFLLFLLPIKTFGAVTGYVLDDSANTVGAFTFVEGTCTPTVTLVGGAGNTTPVYTATACRYTRFGRLIYVDVFLNLDGGNEGAGTGVLNIDLPVTASANHSTSYFPCGYVVNGSSNLATWCRIPASATTVELSYFSVITSRTDITGNDQNQTTRSIRLKFFYE